MSVSSRHTDKQANKQNKNKSNDTGKITIPPIINNDSD